MIFFMNYGKADNGLYNIPQVSHTNFFKPIASVFFTIYLIILLFYSSCMHWLHAWKHTWQIKPWRMEKFVDEPVADMAI